MGNVISCIFPPVSPRQRELREVREIDTKVNDCPQRKVTKLLLACSVCVSAWMISSRVYRASDRQGVNAGVATALGLIPASSDTVESKGRQMKQF
jgi:hypothetical protein